MSKISLRKCKPKDIPSIEKLQPEGWENVAFYFQFYCQQSFCYPIVAIIDDEIIGVANGTLNGKTGWLAHIVVSEKHRNKGVGLKLTQEIINYLSAQNCKTQILISTELGKKLYEKLGFKISGYYCFYNGPKLKIKTNNKNIRPIKQSDLNLIFELDKQISGETRKHMIEKYSSNGVVYFGKDELDISGYYFSEFGEGLICAKNDFVGIELLKYKHSQKGGRAVLPIENESGRKFLENNDYKLVNKAPRMVLGEEVNWKPHFIFSRIGGFYG
jgi:GNAT superfamily N-acetyltransferase